MQFEKQFINVYSPSTYNDEWCFVELVSDDDSEEEEEDSESDNLDTESEFSCLLEDSE